MRNDQNPTLILSVASVLVAMTFALAAFTSAADKQDGPAVPAVRESAPAHRDPSIHGLIVAANAETDTVIDMTYPHY